jgi:succinate dehydrogenase / fumarate reductase cytochrome b subunit
MSAATSTTPVSSGFLRARLGSLLAFAPLGVWTFVHLWNNLAAFQGEDAWRKAVTEYPHPVAQLVTAVIVLLPLVLHTVWGIGRLLSAKPNNQRYGTFENLKYLLQRLSAVGVMFFLGAHLWLAMLHPRLVEGHAEAFGDISHEMRTHLPTLVVYLLGSLGVSYHLANGISTFAMGWGLVSSRRAMARMNVLSIATMVVLVGMAWATIYALYRSGS